MLARLLRGMARPAEAPLGPQMSHQLLLQHASGLHIKAAIDGLVRHLAGLVPWISPLQPARDLLGRPVQVQLRRNSVPQLSKRRQLARLRAACLQARLSAALAR